VDYFSPTVTTVTRHVRKKQRSASEEHHTLLQQKCNFASSILDLILKCLSYIEIFLFPHFCVSYLHNKYFLFRGNPDLIQYKKNSVG